MTARRVSVAAGLWALWYAAYRGYYAAGGTRLLPGTIRPGSEGEFRHGNEPWFLLEGLSFGALAGIALGPGRPRRRWTVSAAAATAALTGVLAVLGAIGRVTVA